MSVTRVFVYGTLKRGEVAHAELMSEARFLGSARTPPRYRLVSCGWYPALVEGGKLAVEGEVFEVSLAQLPALDDFEDVPELYRRERLELEGFGPVWIYVMRPEHAQGRPELPGPGWRGRN